MLCPNVFTHLAAILLSIFILQHTESSFASKVAGKSIATDEPTKESSDVTIKTADVESGGTDAHNLAIGGFNPTPAVVDYERSLNPKFYIHRWRFVPSAVLAYLIFVAALAFYTVIRIREMPKLRNSEWFGWGLLILELVGSTATLVYGIC